MRPLGVTDDALRLLAAYAWPGNVRQLQDVLFRAAVDSRTDVLTSADFTAIEAALGGSGSAGPGEIAIHGEAIGVTLHLPDGHLRPLVEIQADVLHLPIRPPCDQTRAVALPAGLGGSPVFGTLTKPAHA